jgi:hypothetical protein
MKTTTVTESGWNISFWFAVSSPVIGAMVGYLSLVLLFH